MGDPSRQKEETAMMNDDLAMRSKDIHWPDGCAPDGADVFAHHEVFINAPRSTEWPAHAGNTKPRMKSHHTMRSQP